MTIASQPVYSTTTSGVRGHVAHFEVERPSSFKHARFVVHLPETCSLFGYPGDLHVETKFYELGHDLVDAQYGTANEELLNAAKIFIDNATRPFSPWIGVRAVVTDGRVALIGYLKREVDADDLCEKLAQAIYEDVAGVDVQYVRARHMGVRERSEWNDYQLLDY